MPVNSEIDLMFFNEGKLRRHITTDDVPVKEPARSNKAHAQAQLLELMAGYHQMEPSATLKELAYANHTDRNEPPRCLTCDSHTPFGRDGWAKFCNASCAMSHPDVGKSIREKSKQRPAQIETTLRDEKLQELTVLLNQKRVKEFDAVMERGLDPNLISDSHWRVRRLVERRNRVTARKEQPPEIPKTTRRMTRPLYVPFSDTEIQELRDSFTASMTRSHILSNQMAIDVICTDKRIAFDFGPASQEKMLAAKADGIRLITVTSEQVYLTHCMNLLSPPTRVFARKCEIRAIDNRTANAFLDVNHRDGHARGAAVAYGLFHGEELLTVATFGRNRFREEGAELYRLATKLGFQVVGGVSKLIKRFLKDCPGKLTTYSSAMWGWGSAYIAADGEPKGLTRPGYFYFDQKSGRKIHRMAMSKGNFEKTTGNPWNQDLSEEENAASVKCYRVYDCGNWKFEWNS